MDPITDIETLQAQGTIWEDLTIKGVDLSGMQLTSYRLTNVELVNCDLSNIKLVDTRFQDVSFTGCKLLGIDFTSVNHMLLQMSFNACEMSLCSLHGLPLKDTLFGASRLLECDFVESDLQQADFSHCDLSATRFVDCNMKKADFREARNYFIDPTCNELFGASFSLPEAVCLLQAMGMNIEY